eukprot:2479689-Pyramimonas_sp.AAC.1
MGSFSTALAAPLHSSPPLYATPNKLDRPPLPEVPRGCRLRYSRGDYPPSHPNPTRSRCWA